MALPANLISLPHETKLNILRNLSTADLVNICETNIEFREICKDEVLWEKLAHERFPAIVEINSKYIDEHSYYELFTRL